MIEFKVEEDSLKEIEKKLGSLSDQAPKVMKKAVNDTAKQARKRLSNQAKQKYTIKVGSFNKAMKIKNASVSKPEAVINATGGVQELIDFKVSPNKVATGKNRPDLTRGKVLKSSSLKPLEMAKGNLKAFVTRFRNGHIAIVQRVPGKKMKSNPKKDFIKKLLSPSIPKMIGNEKDVYGIVEPFIADDLKVNINKHINSLLEG